VRLLTTHTHTQTHTQGFDSAAVKAENKEIVAESDSDDGSEWDDSASASDDEWDEVGSVHTHIILQL
jgi:hypothetical protein